MEARRVGRMGLLAAVLAAFLLGSWSCGGGGGGGDGEDGGQAAPEFPSSIEYGVGRGGLILQMEGISYQTALELAGTFRKASRSYTLETIRGDSGNLALDGRLNVLASDSAMTPSLGFRWGIIVLEPLQWDYGAHLASGAFRVQGVQYVDVRVNRNVNASGQAGVDLEYTAFEAPAGSSSHTWAEFEGLRADAAATPYQRAASFAYFLLRIVYDHVQLLMEQYEYISANDAALQAAGSGVGITDPCVPYQGQTGSRRFVWTDGPGENPRELGPGDHFDITYTGCYQDRGAAGGTLYSSGAVRDRDYMEGSNPFLLGSLDRRFDALVSTSVATAGGAPAAGLQVTASSFGFVGNDLRTDRGFQVFLLPDTSTRIHAGNAWRVAEAAIEAIRLPPQVGSLVLDRFIDVIEGEPPAAFCEGGGTYAVAPAPTANPPAGSTYSASFTNCTTAGLDPVTFQGTLTLRVDDLTGPLSSSGNYSVAFTLDPIAVTTTDDVGPNTLSGATRFERTVSAGGYAETSRSVSGKTLTTSESDFSAVLGPYELNSGQTAAGAYSFGASGQSVRIARSDLGILDVQVLAAISGTGALPPTQGQVRVVADDGGRLIITVSTAGVTLAVDADGNGTAEDTLGPIPWIDLFD